MREIGALKTFVCFVSMAFLVTAGLGATQEKIDLNILYAGNPSSPRTADFVEFLSSHFASVETVDLAKLSEEDTQRFDIILLDHDAERPPRPKFSDTYDVPTVTIGDAGAQELPAAPGSRRSAREGRRLARPEQR